SILPRCERFLSTAIDACRTNIIPLFEAIACENPYPARYFPELNFNQMVLKCMFNPIALRRIVGLQSRLNPELSRMATTIQRNARLPAVRCLQTLEWLCHNFFDRLSSELPAERLF